MTDTADRDACRRPHDGLRAALDGAARLGPYFAVGCDTAPDAPAHAARRLHDPGDEALSLLVGRVRDRLGNVETRVAASVLHLGLAARLLSPALAVLLVDGAVPHLPAQYLTVRQSPEGSLRLGIPPRTGRLVRTGPSTGTDALSRLESCVFAEHLAPLAAHLRHRYRLSPRLLAGNVASAAAGAVRVLPPALREDGLQLLGNLLDDGPSAGTGALEQGPGGWSFTRRSCCLYYRVPGGGTCADCPIPPAARSPAVRRTS